MPAEMLLLTGNPSRRRKTRSAAQRAATRKMLAANRRKYHRNPAPRLSLVSSGARHSAKRTTHRRRRVSRIGSPSTSMLSAAKVGLFGAAGAILDDVLMGLVANVLPNQPMITSPTDTNGNPNPIYYVAKLGIAYGIGRYGSRFTRHANVMAMGATALIAYQAIKSYIPPGTLPMGKLGYFNPARVVSGGVGRILPVPASIAPRALPGSGLGRIVPLNAPGARAAAGMRGLGRR